MSNTLDSAPWGDTEAELLRGDGVDSVATLKQRHQGIVVLGQPDTDLFAFAAGLVDELRLRIVPVLIGAGWSFTPASLGHARLALESTATHPSGHVSLTYRLR